MRQAIRTGVWLDKGAYKPIIREWDETEIDEGASTLTDEDIAIVRLELMSVGLDPFYRRKKQETDL